MQKINKPPIAGPIDHPQVGSAVRNVRSMMLLRDRIHEVARSAVPPHRRRPAKGNGKWPARLPLDSL